MVGVELDKLSNTKHSLGHLKKACLILSQIYSWPNKKKKKNHQKNSCFSSLSFIAVASERNVNLVF